MISLITNTTSSNLRNKLNLLTSKADRIEIAVAFFSDSELIKQWDNKKINLIVSLRPPTSFHSLKELQSSLNVEINFLGDDFHSKFFLFYKNNELIGGVIGSSNFTYNGLVKNIETNVLIKDKDILLELQQHFNELLQNSNLLHPTDLDNYESLYNNWLTRQKIENAEIEKFQKATKNRTKRKQKVKVSKKARQYFEFWRIVDEVKDLVKDISYKEYPNVPIYFTIDHFWHYMKAYLFKENQRELNKNNQLKEIPKLFSEYIEWSKEGGEPGYLEYMAERSKNIFQKYLSEKNIDKLTKSQAKEIFENLHSSELSIKRFGADKLFISENSIKNIRTSLKYLLYSNDDMDLRIYNLMNNPKYKLNRIGPSSIQELNGWKSPDVYPIRNEKADKALEILGYKLD